MRLGIKISAIKGENKVRIRGKFSANKDQNSANKDQNSANREDEPLKKGA